MATIIQHNITAMNVNRQLENSIETLAKSTEKLSSGYRINRAADDAAGLAISGKMRSQIRSLAKASNNMQNGISLTQVADGGLNEITSVLQRMREVSIQAANDTNTLLESLFYYMMSWERNAMKSIPCTVISCFGIKPWIIALSRQFLRIMSAWMKADFRWEYLLKISTVFPVSWQ